MLRSRLVPSILLLILALAAARCTSGTAASTAEPADAPEAIKSPPTTRRASSTRSTSAPKPITGTVRQ